MATESVSKELRVHSLKINVIVAQVFGVPLILRENTKCTRFLVVSYFLLCLILFDILYLFCELFDLFYVGNNINAIAQNFCLTISHFGGCLKFLNIMYRSHDLQSIIEELRRLPSAYMVKPDHDNLLRSSEKVNMRIVKVYVSTIVVTFFVSFGTLIQDPSMGGKFFPFRAFLPDFLPLAVRIMYWSFGVLILGMQIMVVDTININLINQVRFHLKVLNSNLLDLASVEGLDKDPYNVLVDCIKYHKIILGFRDEIEDIFKYPLLAQFVISILTIVATGFQAVVLSEGVLLIYFYCSGLSVQLFSYCWFANQVMEENKLLFIAGYSTNWVEFGTRYSKILQIFMITSQRPLTFTLGGFFSLSLNTFTVILSRSYSCIAVLRQVYAE